MTTRATIIFSLALLILGGMFFYVFEDFKRFQLFTHKDGLFIFDTKRQILTYCTEEHCKIVPHKENDIYSAVPYRDLPMPSISSLAMQERYPIVIKSKDYEPSKKEELKKEEEEKEEEEREEVDTQRPVPRVQTPFQRQGQIQQPQRQEQIQPQPFQRPLAPSPQPFQRPLAPSPQPMMPMAQPPAQNPPFEASPVGF